MAINYINPILQLQCVLDHVCRTRLSLERQSNRSCNRRIMRYVVSSLAADYYTDICPLSVYDFDTCWTF